MAKLQGIVGGLSGKLGNAVFRQRYGQTVASQYQPVVANPNTKAQSDNRTAFKLISQLAAVLAPAIAITRTGAVSSRNGFTSVNYPLLEMDNIDGIDVAKIDIKSLQLTKSAREIRTRINSVSYDPSNRSVTAQIEASPKNPHDRLVIVIVSGYGSLSVNDRPARLRGQGIINKGSTTVNIEVGPVDEQAGEKLFALVYGIDESAAAGKQKYNNMGTVDDAAVLASELRAGTATAVETMTEGYDVQIRV